MSKCPKCEGDYIALHEMTTGLRCWRCAADEMVFEGAERIEK